MELAVGEGLKQEILNQMLPSPLLIVRRRKSEIQPRYATLSVENIEAARELIETYKSHVGEKKKLLNAAATNLENQGFDYRFIRGLSLLLDRRGSFAYNSRINPVDLRRKIFQAVQEEGAAFNKEKRKKIMEKVAIETSLDLREIEEAFYSDLDEELILEKFDPPSPVDLLQHYNFSLTQTLLFGCTELSFRASGNWQNIFFVIKKLGLIYEAYKDSSYCIRIDGPLSLFKLTKRYGVNIAKLLPVITNSPEWSLDAKIVWKFTNEIYDFRIESQKYSSLFPKPKLKPLSYDSAVEEEFSSKFIALRMDWILRREPEPVSAGTEIILPDFSLERAGLKIYVEIVGFWTQEYLLRKAEKLKHVQEKMLLLVNEELACEKLTALSKRPQLHFIYFKNKISMVPILQYLEKAFEETKAEETKFLENLDVKFTEPIISFAEFAQRIGVSVETVQTALLTNPPKDYVALSNSIISKNKLAQMNKVLEECLRKTGKLMLDDATKIIEAEGVNDASSVLNRLGYKIKWQGINSEKAEVYKKT